MRANDAIDFYESIDGKRVLFRGTLIERREDSGGSGWMVRFGTTSREFISDERLAQCGDLQVRAKPQNPLSAYMLYTRAERKKLAGDSEFEKLAFSEQNKALGY